MSSIRASGGRREANDDEIVLGVLDAVERNQHVTQRIVASEVGIALGLANAYLKRCVRKGLVKISEVPHRRYAYYLTPQGFAEKSRLTASYLAHSFSFFRNARTQLSDIFFDADTRGHRRLALVGDGDLAEIARLVARESRVEIARIIENVPTAGVSPFADIDAVVITDVTDPRAAYDRVSRYFDPARVYVPALLRLSSHRSSGEEYVR